MDLAQWSPNFSFESRTVWLRCYGVPLKFWDSLAFEEVGNKFGEIIGVAKDTLEKSVLEYGRVCVSSNRQLLINQQESMQSSRVASKIGFRVFIEGDGSGEKVEGKSNGLVTRFAPGVVRSHR